ncbi:MAG: DUF805 domain-containing protein [Rhodobacterales bacterium]|nr:DUF805 domain-containing protein [Rhodobacterales bacterium]
MTFANAIRTCLRKYVTFSGRASRSEYWWFVLFIVLGSIVLALVDGALFGTTIVDTAPGAVSVQTDGPLATLFSLATLVPALSAGWRRMHDTGRSGLYLLYPLIVMVGLAGVLSFFGGIGALDDGTDVGLAAFILVPAMIILAISPLLVLWWLARPSQRGANSFGPNPHEVHQ